MDGQEAKSETAAPRTAESPKKVSLNWVWILVSVFGLCILVEIAGALGWLGWISEWPVAVRRIFDVLLYLVAGGLGIALSHWRTKRSMATTQRELGSVVQKSLEELREQLAKKRATPATKGPIPLPIPYMVAKMRDMGSTSFGYFGARLVNREPRLLLDLSLAQALTTLKTPRVPHEATPTANKGQEIWALTQEISKENEIEQAKTAGENTATKVAKDVVQKLKGLEFPPRTEAQIQDAVVEAVKKAIAPSATDSGEKESK